MKFWLKDNIVTILISIIFGFASVIMGKDLFSQLGVDIISDSENINYFHAYISGLLGQALLQKLKYFIPTAK